MGLPAQRPRFITKREAEGAEHRAALEAEGVTVEEYAQGTHALVFLALSNTLTEQRLAEVLGAFPHLRQ